MFRNRLISFAVMAWLPLSQVACGDHVAPVADAMAPLVRVATVRDALATSRSFTGVVTARVQGDLGFRVPGKVLERLVDAGQTVKRGQLLFRMDPVDLRLAVNAQQEAVVAAQARAKQTADDEARYRALIGTGAISASAYDQAKAAADAAQAQLSAAQAQASVAKNAAQYAELTADADGVVVDTLAEPGQVVGAGQVVVRIAHSGQREAVVQLPETLRPALGSVGQATLYGLGERPSQVRLRQLSNAADKLTRTFEARYVLDGALGNAPLGATVTIKIPQAQAAGVAALQVPIAALLDTGKGAGVWVVTGSPECVVWRPVSVLGLSDDAASVAGNVKAGERIVALGAHLLKDGQAVRVDATAPLAQAAAPGAQP